MPLILAQTGLVELSQNGAPDVVVEVGLGLDIMIITVLDLHTSETFYLNRCLHPSLVMHHYLL